MVYLAAVLAIFGGILLWISSRQRRAVGLPAGKIIYADHNQWTKVETALYDPTFNLTGKPDYIVETNHGLIPVEVKSGRANNAPYDSHIYQLAAYCLLIEQTFGTQPQYGILHYSNQDIQIDYTKDLQDKTIEILRDIRSMSRKKSISRSHESVARCQKCGYNSICEEALNY
jgi:CRISPR-associated exonuclease Cas4